MPNFYGESPAIQIMPIKSGEKIDTSLLKSIETALEKSKLKNTGLILENFNIKVKFKTAEDQLKAKSVIQNSLGDKYVVALNLISNSPNWLSNMGALPMYLGLDLRGASTCMGPFSSFAWDSVCATCFCFASTSL